MAVWNYKCYNWVHTTVNEKHMVPNWLEDELVLLTVDQLLLGQNSLQKPRYNYEGELTTLAVAKEFQPQLINAWSAMWEELSFLYLLSFYSRADTKKYTNLEISTICQPKRADKISKYYQFCIVVMTLLSKDGVVCTVTIAPDI